MFDEINREVQFLIEQVSSKPVSNNVLLSVIVITLLSLLLAGISVE